MELWYLAFDMAVLPPWDTFVLVSVIRLEFSQSVIIDKYYNYMVISLYNILIYKIDGLVCKYKLDLKNFCQ